MTDFLTEIERWAALLPLASERRPARIKMTMATFVILHESVAHHPVGGDGQIGRFDAVPVTIDDDLIVPWICYDQYGEEMGRAS
jgi:hypothetical protein